MMLNIDIDICGGIVDVCRWKKKIVWTYMCNNRGMMR
jgi:hypothetical protein